MTITSTRREMLLGMSGGVLGSIAAPSLAALPGNAVNVRSFGAKGDGRSDDSTAVRAAHEAAKRRDAALLFPAGRYRINGWADQGGEPIRWFSDEGAQISVGGTSLAFSPVMAWGMLRGVSRRGQRTINLVPGPAIRPGALIHITARKVVERYRGEANACQTALVTGVDGGVVQIDVPLNFSFSEADPDARYFIYNQPRQMEFEGLDFITLPGNGHGRSVSLIGMHGGTPFRNCGVRTDHDGDVNLAPDGLMVQQSIGATAVGLRIRNCRYGYMVSRGARDCGATDIVSEGNRHPIYPSYWAYRCAFRRLRGRRNITTLDSHSAFDVTYQDVDVRDDLEMSNIRSSGAALIDAVIRTRSKPDVPAALFIAPQNWIPEYRDLAAVRDVVLRNVSLIYDGASPKDGRAVFIGGARKVVLDRVKTMPGGLSMKLPVNRPKLEMSGTNLKAE